MRHALIAFVAALMLSACGQSSSSVMDEIARAEKEASDHAAALAAQSPDFIARQRDRAGVRTTSSGLVYEITRPASNTSLPRPPRDAEVLVEYEGKLPDGTVFDSSAAHGGPANFPITGVVPGFGEALMLMRPGEEIVAYLPANLAYGERGSLPTIPPNVALEFRIRLLAFARRDGTMVAMPGLNLQGR
ncbi:MAG: FKBP-type peptidyl-prolyl cis-trans isomerase [Hyphomonadaceae bacterium]